MSLRTWRPQGPHDPSSCATFTVKLPEAGLLQDVNNAIMNTGVHVSFRIVVFSGYIPSSGIVGSYGSFIPNF